MPLKKGHTSVSYFGGNFEQEMVLDIASSLFAVGGHDAILTDPHTS
jgi:hypothetical protein